MGFETPTPIQAGAIPQVLSGRDVMGLAQTGTGKTAAFGLPLVHKLLGQPGKPQERCIKALVLAPTRELVNQIAENLKAYTAGTKLKTGLVVGGASIRGQIQRLSRGTDILVATPGRLLDLVERRAVFLDTATFLVLDEADQMLDLGFIHALRKIATLVGDDRQTMLFSATMPKNMAEIAGAYLRDPVRIEVAPPGKAADKVKQCVHFVEQAAKADKLVDELAQRPDAVSVVFARTKHGAEKLMKKLVASGFKAASIHGNKSQGQRERAIQGLRDGVVKVLVATDVAARGIDIRGVTHVYNFDLPEVAESYVHRIGRTARAGADGEGIAFCAPEEYGLLRAIERLMKIDIEIASGEPPARAPRGGPRRGRRPGGGGGGYASKGGPKSGGFNKKPASGKGQGRSNDRNSNDARGANRGPRRQGRNGSAVA
ncbi:MAG: DEAD/DEAH box helicase [Neomegalonema sp.]|nr:DEAD/DEAH box helicase [Neomegalonema sp.]